VSCHKDIQEKGGFLHVPFFCSRHYLNIKLSASGFAYFASVTHYIETSVSFGASLIALKQEKNVFSLRETKTNFPVFQPSFKSLY
jgi:hypothetical protein